MNLLRQLQILEIYENCIFKKMHARPYNKVVMYTKEVLEHIHIDLWALSPMLSTEGTYYFILIINSTFLFQSVEFLKEKTTKTILKVLKSFIIEAEYLMEQKLKKIRVEQLVVNGI